MATRKTTKPKSEKSAPRTRKKAEPAPEVQESAGLSRAAWGAIWAGLGVLTLLALLPIDGALLRWLHRFIGGFIGRGGLLLPFALFFSFFPRSVLRYSCSGAFAAAFFTSFLTLFL